MERSRDRRHVATHTAPHRADPDRLSGLLAAAAERHAIASPANARPGAILGLQRRGGNHAVQRVVALQRTEAEAKVVAKQVSTNGGAAPRGYEGGRVFGNREGRLPRRDRSGPLRYWEYDVHPLPSQAARRRGVSRDAERVVIDSNWVAWYTSDHYRTFKRITY